MPSSKSYLVLYSSIYNVPLAHTIISNTFQFADSEIQDWEYGHENHDEPRRFIFEPNDWNPDRLDCAQWAKVATSAGIKFAALTAKHHMALENIRSDYGVGIG
ncbi:alpha-L-fucosidase [Paenibacillus apiarius]|uniref:Alpha-L-fucosidase n=1 Tax=Paenibacillus apiarius TaxID=46240 RepID=A0ABT4DVF3_9BACL|nr:alpha-L-fucosidase [Paenibacillus apiarius]MCY9514788.1 alpha-L-fucosidase [Paenibacillus apiarius]MCY9521331.1 alpha-L-fucosidase [Paenibacillus apiarius]MCY9554047.1 alpha-L-fucosidase [Paenibacillus apiarius]MCY9560421.1 alpha-L-fucosidase [Paenibacillus apiarius]MCY9682241.1 alpha-L-fucosidase [Paenibacillus apiarius]